MRHSAADRIIGLYSEKAAGWIEDRAPVLGQCGGTGLDEAGWLAKFMACLPSGARVLDVGCGSGWPVAAALLEHGFRVTGVDPVPGLLDHAAQTLPAGEWIVGDMRTLELGRTFDGVLAWFSLFHLTPEDQRIALPRILAHVVPGGVIMFPTGSAEGVQIGQWRGEPLYHGSLGAQEYRAILNGNGFVEIGDATDQRPPGLVWLARRV
ncbi:hypothetical protein KOAAANKH_01269 [Brevundimonas sp. NIBR10]|uniref:class I SAM-dependent methyltransferase n=1 Tax=Brevundimonas sp. NIBR10 TaxID=3015997 RepID=UPI0022F14FBB|nr:class I SAM-dependent methyltransferase [Brevundimonas sp. NIBR10]WGM46401.1 hypothetical protein KOAAANKH_01269 [Brevundimonas sp. NIBR10]